MIGRIRKIYKDGLEMIMEGRIRKVNDRTDKKDSWQDELERFMVGRIRKTHGWTDRENHDWTDQKESWLDG